MFDIRKAFEAAIGLSRDKSRRTELTRFMARASETRLPVCQWRTVGGTADMVEKFLTELGFGEKDYSVDVSTLDPSVRTFRWGTTGRYEKLRKLLENANTEFQADGDLFVAMAFRINNDGLGLTDHDMSAGLVGELPDDGTTSSDAPSAFIDSLDLARKTAARYEDYNDSVTDESLKIVPGDEAVPDLATIERICRELGAFESSDNVPKEPVFGTGHRDRQIRTVIRHMGSDESLDRTNMFASIVVPAAYAYESASTADAPANPLRGYLYRDSVTCSNINAGNASAVVLFGCEELDKSVDATVFGSNPVVLREYVVTLYSRFFGIPTSRIGITPWSLLAIPGMTRNANINAERDARRVLEIPEDPNVLIYKFCVVIKRDTVSDRRYTPLHGLDSVETSPFTLVEEGDNESAYRDSGVTSDVMAREWYDIIHRYGKTDTCHGWYYGGNAAAQKRELEKARRMWTRSRTKSSLKSEASFDDNRCFRFDTGDGDGYQNPVTAFIVRVGCTIRDFATTGFKKATRKGCPSDSVFSRILTDIVPEESELAIPADVDGFVDGLAAKDPAERETEDPMNSWYRLVVETNVAYDGIPKDELGALILSLKKCYTTTIVYGSHCITGDALTKPEFLSTYNFDSNRFLFGVNSSKWLTYDTFHDTVLPGQVLGGTGVDLPIRVSVLSDSRGRTVLVFDVTGKIRNTMLTGFRTHLSIPPVDAAFLAEHSSLSRTSDIIVCPKDKRKDYEQFKASVDKLKAKLRDCYLTPEYGWTQSSGPFRGFGRLYCEHNTATTVCPRKEAYDLEHSGCDDFTAARL